MKKFFSRMMFSKIFFIFIVNHYFLNIPEVKSAEEVKIIYSVFSRTIKVNSLKTFAENGTSTNKLKRILNSTGASNSEVQSILSKNFEIPITIASKLAYSEIGKIFLTRLSYIIQPSKAKDERTGMLALRASLIQGINLGNGKINVVNFIESYPTKTVILNVNALSKIMNKVESISELLDFFTNKPLEKIKTN